MSDYTQSYRKYMISSRLSLLYFVFYKPFEMVGLIKNRFNIMLNLGLSFLHDVGAYKIYTFFFLGNLSKTIINFIWPFKLTTVLY